mmetsp:Transcript_1011/g.1539  ORF Transcript_1011/g.1539 Transcript_1011/m.1539 type:complete len:82 (+) Transcript_1011:348-593(+)
MCNFIRTPWTHQPVRYRLHVFLSKHEQTQITEIMGTESMPVQERISGRIACAETSHDPGSANPQYVPPVWWDPREKDVCLL